MKRISRSLARLGETLESLGVAPDPIVVLGMHRSGTTMLVGILQRAGIFMGSRLSGNLEPRIFQDANRQIFDYFGGSWLDAHLLPRPGILHTAFPALTDSIADRFCDDLAASFFDSIPPGNRNWGFKDPRTVVTAGLFLRLFPDARAIFIHRDPVDVVLSVIARERKQRRKHPGLEAFEFTGGEFQALMMRTVKAWEVYNERALEVLPMFRRHGTLRYESILSDPLNALKPVFESVGAPVTAEQIREAGIRPERSGSGTKVEADFSKIHAYLEESKTATLLRELDKAG